MSLLNKNKLPADASLAELESRKMLMAAATPTFTGFSSSNRPFSDIEQDLENEANGRGNNFDQNRLVRRNEIDDRGTKLKASDGDTGNSAFGKRSTISDSKIQVHNPLITNGIPGKSSRWYQKDGNTQIFRVFPGDRNTVGSRKGAARSEAFVDASNLTTVFDDELATTFSGEFQVVQHNRNRETMIFQSKGSGDDKSGEADLERPAWGVALFAEKDGDIVIKRREAIGKPIDTGKNVGEAFDLKVVDTGNKYFVTIDGERKATGEWNRGDTPTVARWGAYVQGGEDGVLPEGNAQIVHVSGARVTRGTAPTELQDDPSPRGGNSRQNA